MALAANRRHQFSDVLVRELSIGHVLPTREAVLAHSKIRAAINEVQDDVDGRITRAVLTVLTP